MATIADGHTAEQREYNGSLGYLHRIGSRRRAMATIVDSIESVLRRPTTYAGWRGWLVTVDHKRIGIMYGVTAFIFFLIGGVQAMVMRTQLASSDLSVVSPELYSQLFTMHALTMIFLAVMPMGAAFFNFIIPLQIGARDVAFPRLNALSYWIFLFGGLLLNGGYITGFTGSPNWGCRIDRRAARVGGPPPPDGVKVLERETGRVHDPMADRAGRVRPVLFHPLADRPRRCRAMVLVERRHVGWRRRRRHAKNVIEQPLATEHRGGPGRVGGQGQQTGMPEQSAPYVVVERHPPKPLAVDARHAVVARQTLVHERVVRAKQVEQAVVLAQLAGQKQQRLLFHVGAEVLVEVVEHVRVRHHPA